jgi:cytochrome c553
MTMKRVMGTALLALLLVGGSLHAETSVQEERERLMARIDESMSDPGRLDAAIRAGRERSLLCANCHGENGNSVKSEMPNIAGQNPAYIVEQMMNFAEGRRRDFVMSALTRDFSFEDKVNLAVYYTTQPVEPIEYDEVLAIRGESVYMSSCVHCHGVTGKGEAGYARLAGQQITYVEATLKRYRANANANGRTDFTDLRRSDPSMEQVTRRFTDDDIRSVAHYIAKMR